ncbi:MAG: hypothetical protein II889_06565 [Clostridia bacterium]|nr:hypothetical protein [Clostridia bacterium]
MPNTEEKEALFDTPENAEHLDDTILAISHAAWDEISDEMSEVPGYVDTPIEKKGYLSERTTSGGNWITGLKATKNNKTKTIEVYPSMWVEPHRKEFIFISDAYIKYAKPYAVQKIIDAME